MTPKPRMGRIEFLNVLPVYHGLETGKVPHSYEFAYAPPAVLNAMMRDGGLAVSSTSSFEYARAPGNYLLLPNLSIASHGEVMSVLLLSRCPVRELDGKTVLLSSQSHTSGALARMLLRDYTGVAPVYVTGNASEAMAGENPPDAVLVIGDEALGLRGHPVYAHRWDMGAAWREWTGLPFVFGLWIVNRQFTPGVHGAEDPASLLRAGLEWGRENMNTILDVAAGKCSLGRDELSRYYTRALCFELGEAEQAGLRLFYRRLAAAGEIPHAPELHFWRER